MQTSSDTAIVAEDVAEQVTTENIIHLIVVSILFNAVAL